MKTSTRLLTLMLLATAGCSFRAVVGGSEDAGPVDTRPPGCACPMGLECDPADRSCVDCLDDRGCADGFTCDPATHACVDCMGPTDCEAGSYCDDSRRCLAGCDERTDCTDPLIPACDTSAHTCVVCDSDADCADTPVTPACDVTRSVCVGCASDGDCAGTPETPVCNLATNRCVPCNADADCPATSPICIEAAHLCAECELSGEVDPACPAEAPFCGPGNVCVECRPGRDPSDCAAPGTACTAAGYCAAACDPTNPCTPTTFECCPDPMGAAGDPGMCTNTGVADIANCGGCGNVCPDLPFSTPRCVPLVGRPSTCDITCDTGRGNCDGMAANDCEVNLLSGDTLNCGACGGVCDLPHVDGHECTGGSCGIVTCDRGFGDCNASDPDGCEVGLVTRLNCGACGNICTNTCGDNLTCQRGIAVSMGENHELAVMEEALPGGTTGTSVWCYGRNSGDWGTYRFCGNNTSFNSCGPVQVLLPTTIQWEDVGAGRDFGCALGGGQVWCWGRNNLGQVGNGAVSAFVDPPVSTGLADVVQLTVGQDHACARKSDGSVWCWGSGADGRTGHGGLAGTVSTPTRVTGLAAARLVRAGREHTCALALDGSAHCWGRNLLGQLGDGTNVSSGSPVAVSMPPGVTFSEIQPQLFHTCAIGAGAEAGRLYCWGQNESGQFCDGSMTNRPIPHLSPLVFDAARMVGHFCPTCGYGQTTYLNTSGTVDTCGFAGFLAPGVSGTTAVPVALGSYASCSPPDGPPVVLAEHSLWGYSGLMYTTASGMVVADGHNPPGFGCPGTCPFAPFQR